MPARNRTRKSPRQNVRRLGIQSLERRRLLAVGTGYSGTDGSAAEDHWTSQTALVSSMTAEGEPAPDLVAFAKSLAAAEIKFFGAAWHADTTSQVQLFDDGADHLPFIEVTGPDREFNDVGEAEEVDTLPTWEFQNGTRFEGTLTLAEISSMSGIDIPLGEAPSFVTIEDQEVGIGSPLHIPIDAYDPNGDELTVEVSVANPAAIEAVVLSKNRSIRIDMDGFGDMVFQLFEQRAPVPSGRVADLADSGFYDGIIFHRVVDNFMIQGGDPTGTGTSGSELGFFDDQFHPDLQHNRSGVLSFAKSADDANNSQFFITETPQRGLDFNHSIFGQLVEGDAVREAISEVETVDPENEDDRPVIDVSITTIDVFHDTENAVIMLKAIGNEAITTSVTVTVTDSNGNSVQQTFDVSVVPDFWNSQPFLTEIDVPTEIFVGQTIEIQLDSIDVEGDDVLYLAGRIDGGDLSGTLDQETGLLTITPPAGESGEMLLAIAVTIPPGNTLNFDRQVFSINIVEPPPYYRVNSPADVDGVGGLTARDALLIINAMFTHGGEIDLSNGEVEGLDPTFSYNVSGDLKISALDALRVINALPGGESEQIDPGTDLGSTQTDAVFKNYVVALPIVSDQDDDQRDDLIRILAQFQLGLQTLA